MKYIVLIIDGAAGQPLPERGGKTCLELARTPNLDAMAAEGELGLVRTVPGGMEPSSACACMSVLGYDPVVYYKGRAAIEARSLGVDVVEGEVVFRCNLVTVIGGKMRDYSAGHIGSDEAKVLIDFLNEKLGGKDVVFYPGVSYRHLLKLRGHEDAIKAVCTPPHDIPGSPVAGYQPQGPGSDLLRDLMARSEALLRSHRINVARRQRGDLPVTTIWLFWGSGRLPGMPSFRETYGLGAALTSGVDLLRGLARLAGMAVLDIRGVTDGADSDHAAQAEGALEALGEHDLVAVHIEAPDEAAHSGLVEEKIKAIEDIDREVVGRLRSRHGGDLRVLVMPDHPTPITVRTHTPDPVPFLIWGKGAKANGARRFTEAEAAATGVFIGEGYKIMGRLVGK
ncbi:MAG TPA: cofactor-independent phosphoglycerate mutase [Dehalococcoidales bacterium]|nr:cofactor-independent phosphoglycerate mutase [Dehalococcoidales bacterium]